jgi:hypothetical protein
MSSCSDVEHETPTIALGGSSLRAMVKRISVCPRCTPAAPDASAMSTRSLIITGTFVVACAQRKGVSSYLEELFGLLKELIGTEQYARAAHLGGIRAFFAGLYDRDSASEPAYTMGEMLIGGGGRTSSREAK